MTISAAAAYAGCSRRHVERLLKAGKVWIAGDPAGPVFCHLKRDGKGRIDAVELKNFVDAQRKYMFSRGRRVGFRPAPSLIKLKKFREEDEFWRVSRAITLIGKLETAQALAHIKVAVRGKEREFSEGELEEAMEKLFLKVLSPKT